MFSMSQAMIQQDETTIIRPNLGDVPSNRLLARYMQRQVSPDPNLSWTEVGFELFSISLENDMPPSYKANMIHKLHGCTT